MAHGQVVVLVGGEYRWGGLRILQNMCEAPSSTEWVVVQRCNNTSCSSEQPSSHLQIPTLRDYVADGPIPLACTNALGLSAVAASFAVCGTLFPGMWPAAFLQIPGMTQAVMLLLGSSGLTSWGTSQAILMRFDAQPWSHRRLLEVAMLAVYAGAAGLPLAVHFVLQHGVSQWLLMADGFLLMAGSSLFERAVSGEQRNLFQKAIVARQSQQAAQLFQSSEEADVVQGCGFLPFFPLDQFALTVAESTASPASAGVAVVAARSCTAATWVGIGWLLSVFPGAF